MVWGGDAQGTGKRRREERKYLGRNKILTRGGDERGKENYRLEE